MIVETIDDFDVDRNMARLVVARAQYKIESKMLFEFCKTHI